MTSTAAPPSTGMTISSMCSGSAIIGLASTSSTVSGLSEKIAPWCVIGVDALVDDDLGHRPLVVAVGRRIQGGDLAVGTVLAEVAVGDLELGLR